MMTQSILSGLAVLLLAACATAQNSGYATYSNGNGGVCDGVTSGLPAVAMNAAQFGGGAACGQCVQIQGTGNGAGKTPVSTAPYIAVVNNICPQCAVGDIDLQESGSGKFGITWSFVACPGAGRRLIEGRKMIADTVQPVAEAQDVAEHTEGASAQQQPEEATTQQAATDEAEATPAASPVQAAEEATDATLAETTETTEESTQTAAAPSQEESAAPAAAPVEEPAVEVEVAASPAASPAASSGPQATSRRMLR